MLLIMTAQLERLLMPDLKPGSVTRNSKNPEQDCLALPVAEIEAGDEKPAMCGACN